MKYFIYIILLAFSVISCNNGGESLSTHTANWEKRTIDHALSSSLESGSSYLSVYSEIYNRSEHRTYDLTATISIRNVNRADTIFIEKAEYFDTVGNSIRTYFNKPIYLTPMETVEIVIDDKDKAGGTGANIVFDWKIKPGSNPPLFEGVMISTYGQQGLSFTTQGIRIH